VLPALISQLHLAASLPGKARLNAMRFEWRQIVTFGELLTFLMAWSLGIAASVPESTFQDFTRRIAQLAGPDQPQPASSRLE
jgi:hypothetical protein